MFLLDKVHTPKKYYLFKINLPEGENVSACELTDEEFKASLVLINGINFNIFYCSDPIYGDISYCPLEFDSEHEAEKYYEEHKNNMLWRVMG